MSGFGEHAGFILAAYALAVLIIGGLVLWLLIDGRAQHRRLAELEARGVRRRSARRDERAA